MLLVLLTGVLVPLSFSEQRLRRSCIEAVAVGTGLTVGYTAFSLWIVARGGAPPGAVAMSSALFGLVCVLLCLAIRLVGRWLVQSFMCRLVVRTGTLCWTCAYDLTASESGVCPECGTKTDPQARDSGS